MDGVQLPQGWSHFEEAVYFLPLSSQKFLVLILSTSEGWNAESTLEPPSLVCIPSQIKQDPHCYCFFLSCTLETVYNLETVQIGYF